MSVDYPLQDLAEVLRQTEAHFARPADQFDPPPQEVVRLPYVAADLGCTGHSNAFMV